jgi:2-succinyl-5-enolpyruvyl-6-hydroxy-3-cyclohexene-1-carboxylate synthase
MPATDTYLGLRAFVDELARCGLREACTSPGSRSTPLVLSLAREPRIRATSHIDERSGSFFALGLAKATGVPVALACTSGTAAANYAPAVIEAHEARVPLLVLTADRPPELRELGAGQTIDQVKLYGSAAKWYLEVDDHPATPERCAGCASSPAARSGPPLDGRPGPVHLNFALREPLVLDEPLPEEEPGGGGRAGERPWVTRPRTRLAPAPALLDGLRAAVDGHPRGVIVAGRSERDPGLGEALATLADALALPLLAEPLSGARRGPAAIAHYDALLRDPAGRAHAPDLVLRVGDLPTSKPLRQWLHGLDGALQIAFDAENAWQDPAGAVATIVGADPRVLAPEEPRADRGWLEAGARRPRPRRARSRARSARPGSASRAWPPSSASACRPTRRSSSPPRCPCATSRRSSRRATPAARALQPRRQRHRRHCLDRLRRRRRRPPHRPPHRRRRARPRHRRPARRAPPGARPHDRADQQRRRRHLPLPPRRA